MAKGQMRKPKEKKKPKQDKDKKKGVAPSSTFAGQSVNPFSASPFGKKGA